MMTGPHGFLLENLSFSYGSEPCLVSITCSLEPGHFYGLIGPNGSGKSTLLDILTGFLEPTGGLITFNGERLSDCSRRDLALQLSSVPQSFAFNFDYTVFDVVLMGRYPHISRFSTPDPKDFDRVDHALKLLNVHQLRNRSIRHLSGGEKQRVMLARALAQDTAYLLLDEITANLDINHAISILNSISDLVKNDGRTVIAAMHDLNMVLAFCDRLIVLKAGRLDSFGPVEEVLTEELVMALYQVHSERVRVDNEPMHLRFRYLG